MMLDGDQAVVVSREPDKSITVRGVALSDFSVRWTTALGGKESTLLPPSITQGHIVLGAFAEDMKAAKYTYTVWLLDKSGRMSQNSDNPIVSSQFDRPPAFLGVAHDRLVVSVENKVEVYR